jgi:hypothetical protein
MCLEVVVVGDSCEWVALLVVFRLGAAGWMWLVSLSFIYVLWRVSINVHNLKTAVRRNNNNRGPRWLPVK